jgi:hypothetical protein
MDWLGDAQTPSHGNRWAEVLAMFYPHHYHRGMPDTSHLRPATAAEIADALSFALRYQGRKRVNHADDMMARITADRLVQHLTESGFVLMKGTAAVHAVGGARLG